MIDNIKKAFTLIELLVSIVIIAILVVIVFKIYIQLSNISLKIENEKNLSNEILFLSQTIQWLTDKSNIYYSGYSSLSMTYGITWTLYLTWEDWLISIYSTWDCHDDITSIKDKFCWVQMNKGWELIDLTDKNKIYLTKFYFKLIPYEDQNNLTLTFQDIYHNGVGLYAQGYIKRFNEKSWPFNVMINYETFYNIKKY